MSSDITRRIAENSAKSMELSRKLSTTFKQVGSPPVEAQLAFLKGLVDNKVEADKFLKNPKEYCLKHGIVVSPEVTQLVVHNVINDKGVDPTIVTRYGDKVAGYILDLRAPGGQSNAWVVAAAAVVVAVAAVVTMVVTLLRAQKPEDARVLVGLGQKGMLLPGGAKIDIKTIGIRRPR